MMNYLKTFLPYLFGNKKGKSLEIPLPQVIPWPTLSFEEILMFHTFQNTLNLHLKSIELLQLSKKERFHLFNFIDFLNSDLSKLVKSTFSDDYDLYLRSVKRPPLNAVELQELLNFKNGTLSVFAILSTDRTKPGVLVVRDPEGQFQKDKDQNIWSIPILGLSGRGLPFNHSNGCTPSGVFKIDSVMPMADKNYEFGEFKRLIVNFVGPSFQEEDILKLLPKSHTQLNWWTPCIVGRELGRSLLRIHGTGRKNFNPLTSYYPFVPTSGCLATNEASFLGTGIGKAQDQRLLLNTLLNALNLPVTEENESKIHGLLYVVEFSDNLAALRF